MFYAFDLLQLGDTTYRSKRLGERRAALHRLKFGAPILLSAPLPGTPSDIERVVREAGLEGVVAKRVDSFYEPGIRTRNWIKVKFSSRQKFVIGGYKPAGDSFDSVLVGYYEKRRFFYAGKVRGKSHWGEGVTAEDMKTLRWVKPRVVVEVSFVEWTAGGNLRHASFAGTRTDNPAHRVKPQRLTPVLGSGV